MKSILLSFIPNVTLVPKPGQRQYHLLLTVPGIGRVLGMTILFEVDAIERFETVKDFISYSRLVKGSVASAGKLKGLTGGKMGIRTI